MSPHDAAPDDRRHMKGSATGGKGTPAAVDLSANPRARSTIALFLAGPVIWSVHFMLVYLVVEAGCFTESMGKEVLDPPVPTIVTLVATAIGVLACLISAAWAYRRWQEDRQEQPAGPGLEPPDRGGSLAFAGFLLSLLGVIAVLSVGLPALFLPACLP